MINGFGKLIVPGPKSQLCQVAGIDGVGNCTASAGWGAMESGAGSSLLLERHMVIVYSLVL